MTAGSLASDLHADLPGDYGACVVVILFRALWAWGEA